jgi:hypothetical protein
VLTGLDSAGYPFSIRCRPQVDDALTALRLSVPAGLDLQAGPASILCHSHNLFLWNLRSFLVRGSLEMVDGSWLFRPSRFVPGIGVGGLAGMIRFSVDKRRAAERYLLERGLKRPTVPWGELRRIQAYARGSNQ